MEELELKIGYKFRDCSLLKSALAHSSYANENRGAGVVSNERLEFLGDSVLGFVTAEFLYRSFPDMPEGGMTKLRAELVCEQSLHRVAQELELGKYIRLGKGEEHTGGRTRPSILADAVEAVIAAIYLDGGMGEARAFISKRILADASDADKKRISDYKTALQELIQQHSGQLLTYEMIGESGPDHRKVFTAQVSLNGVSVGVGDGHTKKEAEQAAAKKALEELVR